MKAYEIKVTIKNSNPPIWRKIIIPSDINFMQLHNIIQVAFEWLNYHLYEFTFKEYPERITNDIEAVEEASFFQTEEGKKIQNELGFPSSSPSRFTDVLFAKDTLIAGYLEDIKKFTYVYDFGDWWEHTIEVLNVIDDYSDECPVVTKFKQASPPDDCGGIDGYYDFLERYNDPSDPDREEIKDWAEGQGYSEVYDIEEVNEIMEEVLDYDFDDMFDFE